VNYPPEILRVLSLLTPNIISFDNLHSDAPPTVFIHPEVSTCTIFVHPNLSLSTYVMSVAIQMVQDSFIIVASSKD